MKELTDWYLKLEDLETRATSGPWIQYKVSSGASEGGLCFGADHRAFPSPRQVQIRADDAALIVALRSPRTFAVIRALIEVAIANNTGVQDASISGAQRRAERRAVSYAALKLALERQNES